MLSVLWAFLQNSYPTGSVVQALLPGVDGGGDLSLPLGTRTVFVEGGSETVFVGGGSQTVLAGGRSLTTFAGVGAGGTLVEAGASSGFG